LKWEAGTASDSRDSGACLSLYREVSGFNRSETLGPE